MRKMISVALAVLAVAAVAPSLGVAAPGGVKGTTVAVVPNSGPAGSTVTVRGYNFPRGAQGTVTFDGQQIGTFTVASNRGWSISVTIPADATVGTHEIVASAGDASDTATFTVTG